MVWRLIFWIGVFHPLLVFASEKEVHPGGVGLPGVGRTGEGTIQALGMGRAEGFHSPRGENQNWVRNPIDRFVLSKLEKAGLAPNPEADPRTLDFNLVTNIV